MLNLILTVSAAACISYLIGSVPFGYLIGKLHNMDIRTKGSGNIGATNVTRVIGKKWGRICFLLDFLKGFLPVLAVGKCTGNDFVTVIAILCVVLGHMMPVWLNFKGGKGVSTAAGALLAFAALPLLGAVVVWIVLFYASRYVSLASIFAAVSLPVFCVLFHLIGIDGLSWIKFLVLTALAVLTVLKHSSNIKRLCNGTENRFAPGNKE